MNAWLLALVLGSSAVPEASNPALRSARPGEAAAVAFELLESDDQDDACSAFIEQVRGGSEDPWSFFGVALCAADFPGTRERIVTILDGLPEESPLVLFAHGYLSYLDGDLVTAEELLRRAVDRAPDFALAWNALGGTVQALGDAQAAVPLIERALELSPDLELAKLSLEVARLYTEVFDRLLALLEDLPARWNSLPEPRIPMSGRRPEEILSASSEEEDNLAISFISSLALTPLDLREELIERWFEAREPTEVDLWWPGTLAQEERSNSFDQAALTLEAWLQWATELGRRDAILFAAGMAINFARVRVNLESLTPILRSWVALPPTPGTENGLALIVDAYAGDLFRSGDIEGALEAYKKARVLYRDAGDQLGLGNVFFGQAQVLFRLGDIEGALDAYRKARALYEDAGDRLGQGNASYGEAEVLFRLGDNEAALDAYRVARALFQDVGDRLGVGNTFFGEADILSISGDNEGALDAYRKARFLYQDIGDQLGQGSTFDGEADVLFQLGDNQGALDAYRKAKGFFEATGSQLGQGNVLIGEADVLFRLDEHDGALDAHRKARMLFEAVGDRLGQGNTFRGEADVLSFLGRKEDAFDAYRKARALFEAVGDRLGEGNTFLGEADALFVLGENDGALDAYRKARALFEAVGAQLNQGNTFLGEADVMFVSSRIDAALDAYRKARVLFEAVGDKNGQGHTFDGEADVLRLLGDNDAALDAYREARALFEAVGNKSGQGSTLYGEGDVFFRRGNNERAAEVAAAAGNLLGQVKATPTLILALLLEGRARLRLEDEKAFLHLVNEAIQLFFSYREGFIAEHHRTQIDQGISGAFDLLIPFLSHRPGSLEKALTRSEEARSRVLLDLLTAGGLGGEDAPFDLFQEEDRLQADLARVGAKLRHENDPTRHRGLLSERHVLETKLQRNLYRRVASERQAVEFGQPLDAEAIRDLAAEVGPIVLYYAAPQELLAFFVPSTRKEIRFHSIGLGRDELTELVEAFLYDLANPLIATRANRQARDFWRRLLAPFAEHLPSSGPLTLVPNGPLHELPFEILIDPTTGERLFERWDIAVTPSVSALALARRRHRPPSADDNLVAFAAGVGLNLPETDIRSIARRFPASRQKTFGPAEAEYRYYKELASRARHLLIATRGVHVQGSRRGTYLEILPTEDIHDERLSAAEIAAIRIEAELVALAACDTDRGDALLSDERLTLVRSFLIAGAASVLATRWRIPEDARATRFLQDFYRSYRQGGPDGRGIRKDEALTEARRLAIERGDPAQVWAAWVLVGDAR